MQFQVLVNIYSCKDEISSQKVTMAEWKRSAIVTVWFRVRTLLVSQVWIEFLQFLVARASDRFASSEGHMRYCHWPAKLPMSASLSLLCIKMF